MLPFQLCNITCPP